MDPTIPAPTDIAEVAAAFVAFQAKVSDPNKSKTARVQPKDKSKPAFTYGYADLADVLEHVRPILTENGLCLSQDVVCSSQGVEVTTMVLHSSGQMLDFGPLRLPADGEPKNWGSAITYARRFALMAALGIAASGDDDGRGAGQGSTGGSPGKASSRQIALAKGEAERADVDDAHLRVYLRKTYELTIAEDLDIDKALGLLSKAQASNLIDALKEEVKRQEAAKAAGADPVTGEVASAAADDPDAGKDFWPSGDEENVPGDDAEGARARWAAGEAAKAAPDGKLV
jgi:hypothetical protein